jgi:hypothetical protein
MSLPKLISWKPIKHLNRDKIRNSYFYSVDSLEFVSIVQAVIMCFRNKEFIFGYSLAEGVAAIGFIAGFFAAYQILVYSVLMIQTLFLDSYYQDAKLGEYLILVRLSYTF